MAEAEVKARNPLVWVCVLLFVAGVVLGGAGVFLFAPSGATAPAVSVAGGGAAAGDLSPGWAHEIAMQAIQAIGAAYGAYNEWDFVLHRYPGSPSKCRILFTAKPPKGREERFVTYVDLP